jgi:hypothetical protein
MMGLADLLPYNMARKEKQEMHLNAKSVILTGVLGFLPLTLPVSLQADTTYSYTGNAVDTSIGTFQVTISFDTTLTGGALQNLAPNTNITPSLVSFTISPGTYPNQDTAGFTATDQALQPPPTVQIGTDALGNITSWDISENYFVSFPAFAGENPNDFYGLYTITSTQSGDSITLILDNDAGFAPGDVSNSSPGTWSPTYSAVPEPSGCILLGSGLLTLLASAARRGRRGVQTEC